MKVAIIILLVVLVTILGFSVFSLQKELLSARDSAAFYEKRNDETKRELIRLSRLCADKERFLNEIEQSITELDRKIDLETLKRRIPKETWDEIKPIIDKLKAFQQERENEKNH